MSNPGVEYRKVSWTIEADVLERVRERVPRGRQSVYVTTALRRQLERDGLADVIGELVAANGRLDEDAVSQYVDDWQ